MTDKTQILNILRDTFQEWDDLVAGMSDARRSAPLIPSHWSTKDVIAHLRAWQQRTLARMEAGLENREPKLPVWPVSDADMDGDGNVDKLNDWIYETHRDQPWPDVYREWREGFLRIIDISEAIPEKDLLEPGKYPWIWGHPLVFILESTCEHHAEHMEWLQESLRK